MNRFFKQLVALAALSMSFSGSALADMEWGNVYAAPSIVYNDDDPDRLTDDAISGIKIAGGRPFGDYFALEGSFTYSDIDGFYRQTLAGPYVRGSEPQLDLEASVLAYFDREATFAPYAAFGIGYQQANLNYIDTESNPTVSFGFGFDWKIGSSPFAVRTEARIRRINDGGDRTFNDSLVSIGFKYTFDPTRRPPRDLPQDSDGDGVLDMWDACPDTRPGAEVDARGCEIGDLTRDTDRDRVPDARDQCPNTPLGAPVNADGCSLDSDMDGVLTGQDRCPGSRPGADVDEFGCEADEDQDGVLNQRDSCPGTPRGARVDINGCEISDVIRLPGVNFGSGSDLLLPGFEGLLRDAAATLNKNPDLKVEVAGHTDDVGDANLNMGLSDRRAKTVMDYLIRYGVDPSRLSFRGYGESEPIANNTTVEGRAQNRRVELRIIRE